jgi:hypothetical protein
LFLLRWKKFLSWRGILGQNGRKFSKDKIAPIFETKEFKVVHLLKVLPWSFVFVFAISCGSPSSGDESSELDAFTSKELQNNSLNGAELGVEVGRLLLDGGVLNLPTSSKTNSIGVNNGESLLSHFICIANQESVFNRSPVGVGGNGLLGINKMHIESKGICSDLTTSVDTLRKNKKINIDCAFRLYRQFNEREKNGLGPWGPYSGGSWGSNSKCSTAAKKKVYNDLAEKSLKSRGL